MKTISKSKYILYKKCPKLFWNSINNPIIMPEPDEAAQGVFEDGKIVGDYAKKYFDNTVDVTTFDKNGNLNIGKMIALTVEELQDGINTIAEASFNYDNIFCSVDLLHPVEGGYEIYEVKASTSISNYHIMDIAFQKHVLELAGLNIVNCFILNINNKYIRQGDLDLHKLFNKTKVDNDELFIYTLNNIENEINELNFILENEQPNIEISQNCKSSKCQLFEYCHSHLPKPNVFDIYDMRGCYSKIKKGIITFEDVINNNIKLGKYQKVQIESYLNNITLTVDKEAVNSFLNKLKYPIYHLDFESITPPVPLSDNAWPYEQITTQYSLHIEHEDGSLDHKEFLGDSVDPRREIALQLCEDIPMDSCVMAFNKSFECKRLEELASLYPDLNVHLLNISNNIVDLADPFSDASYYHKDMGKRYSIKSVLPALYPNDPELDYHSLPGVHNGTEAKNIYLKMLSSDENTKKEIRHGLLEYCKLDTLAMVKILKKLKESIN